MGQFSKGDKVRDRKWGGTHTGTIVRTDDDSVYVKWDNSIVEDQLSPHEVEKL